MRTLKAEPLTPDAFAPFGDVIEASADARQISINYGNTTRFHDLAQLALTADGGKAGVSIFRSSPLDGPITVKVMEYHPKSSQAFVPLSGRPYLVVVAPKGPFDASKMRAFLAGPGQGVNYHAGTWHHFSLALEDVSDFLVIDRIADDDNCVEHELSADEQRVVSF
ncbi:ureidoglycolate lyase [Kordiimonas lacus]|uniref:Ureidoglycolate lyase n=1 Tax=Kordiimonas lacus TaxID=637679 RepID=A0A1G6U8P5_9PROT|nr:ureidoglycolate lyase [Kordiimonas lacus]SDD37669.1 ureidoglycolate lyase [Kordiimonas lacus]